MTTVSWPTSPGVRDPDGGPRRFGPNGVQPLADIQSVQSNYGHLASTKLGRRAASMHLFVARGLLSTGSASAVATFQHQRVKRDTGLGELIGRRAEHGLLEPADGGKAGLVHGRGPALGRPGHAHPRPRPGRGRHHLRPHGPGRRDPGAPRPGGRHPALHLPGDWPGPRLHRRARPLRAERHGDRQLPRRGGRPRDSHPRRLGRAPWWP